ncbi:MAG TPA: EboA domain-containing protein [Polyangiaceae bacterium]|jgi:hypothetical protein|nr:EboA domain-containing protein [Polyangiaceae bacterium]
MTPGNTALPKAIALPLVEEQLSQSDVAAAWLTKERADAPLDRMRVRRSYAAVGRALAASPAEAAVPGTAHWTWLDWGRLWILQTAMASIPATEHVALATVLYRNGELGEQQSLLKTLWALPEAERFVDLAVDACRTNATFVFEALVCDNPFLAAYFPELAFNQAIMKAIFMELPLGRVIGLETRLTPELQRMASALESERRAAGRIVPQDLERLVRGGSATTGG